MFRQRLGARVSEIAATRVAAAQRDMPAHMAVVLAGGAACAAVLALPPCRGVRADTLGGPSQLG